MSHRCAIALAGLAPTERSLIEGALVQTASALIPGAFIEADPARADLIIANADDAGILNDIRSRTLTGRVVLLGSSDQGTGWPLVPRPLRLQALIEAVRRQLAAQPMFHGAAAPKDTPEAGDGRGWFRRFGRQQPVFSDTQPFAHEADDGFAQTRQFESIGSPPRAVTPSPPAPAPARAPDPEVDDFQVTRQFSLSVPSVAPSDWEQEVAEWEPARPVRPTAEAAPGPAPDAPIAPVAPVAPVTAPEPEPEPDDGAPETVPCMAAEVDRILLVGLPGPAPDGLIRLLEAQAYPVDFATSPQAMVERLARNTYQYVVLIEVSLGSQVIRLCRHVRRHPGRSSPDVRLLIVASHNGLLDRARAWFAGCREWLKIPLDQARLLGYLDANRSGRRHAS